MVTYSKVVQKIDFEEESRYNDLNMLFCDLMKNKGLENDGVFYWIKE